MQGCESVRILTRFGEELLINLTKQWQAAEYLNYIKVAEEFYEWAFSTVEERQLKEQAKEDQREAVRLEVEKIQRTLYVLSDGK